MKIGSLLLATVFVAPLASCGASLIVGGTSVAAGGSIEDPGSVLFVLLFLTVFATIISLIFVFVALLLIALPLTLLATRLGWPAAARDLILLAAAGIAGYALSPLSALLYEGHGWIYLIYALAAAVLWILALHYIERRTRTA